jgi:hypothetical protein
LLSSCLAELKHATLACAQRAVADLLDHLVTTCGQIKGDGISRNLDKLGAHCHRTGREWQKGLCLTCGVRQPPMRSNEPGCMKLIENHNLGSDLICCKKSNDGGNVRWSATKTSDETEKAHKVFWAIFTWIMDKETKAGKKWAKKTLKAFNAEGHSDSCKFKNTLELGDGGVTPKQEPLACFADFLAIDGTFKVVQEALKGMAKNRISKQDHHGGLFQQDRTMEACFEPQERISKAREQHNRAGSIFSISTEKTADEKKFDNELLAATNKGDSDGSDQKQQEGLAMHCSVVSV